MPYGAIVNKVALWLRHGKFVTESYGTRRYIKHNLHVLVQSIHVSAVNVGSWQSVAAVKPGHGNKTLCRVCPGCRGKDEQSSNACKCIKNHISYYIIQLQFVFLLLSSSVRKKTSQHLVTVAARVFGVNAEELTTKTETKACGLTTAHTFMFLHIYVVTHHSHITTCMDAGTYTHYNDRDRPHIQGYACTLRHTHTPRTKWHTSICTHKTIAHFPK